NRAPALWRILAGDRTAPASSSYRDHGDLRQGRPRHPAPDRAPLAGGRAMSPLRNAVADYLTMRRALGYKLDKAERLLGQFVAFAEDRGEAHVRTGTALAWATRPSGAAAIWTSRRLAEVR